MWKPGDIITIRFCDCASNQEILRKPLLVKTASQTQSPNWTEVEYEGRSYTVRGAEARKVV